MFKTNSIVTVRKSSGCRPQSPNHIDFSKKKKKYSNVKFWNLVGSKVLGHFSYHLLNFHRHTCPLAWSSGNTAKSTELRSDLRIWVSCKTRCAVGFILSPWSTWVKNPYLSFRVRVVWESQQKRDFLLSVLLTKMRTFSNWNTNK